MDNENLNLPPDFGPFFYDTEKDKAAPLTLPVPEAPTEPEENECTAAAWEADYASSLYEAPKPLDPKKAERKARRRKTAGKVFTILLACVLFFAAFTVGSLISAGLLSDALQNGRFSFRSFDDEESVTLPEPEYDSIAAIAQDLRRSSCTVIPNKTRSFENYCSGVLVAERGDLLYVITCYHSLEDASLIGLRFFDTDKTVPALIRGYDRETDLCLLYVYKSEIPTEILKGLRIASFADSRLVQVGELALVIGNPMEKAYQGSVSCGVISSPSRQMTVLSADQTSGTTYYLIQTDAAVNPGDSGCALVDGRGQLIGICNAYVDTVEGEGIGFAVPSEKVVPVVEALIENGRIARPFLGIVGTDVSGTSLAGSVPDGAWVENVTAGGPADLAGILSGDIITEFDGVRVTSFDEVKTELAKHKVGDTVLVRIFRISRSGEREYLVLPLTILDKTDFNN